MQFSGNNVSCASRSGEVVSITHDNVMVNIMNTSACAACHAKGMCSAFDQKEKTVCVPNSGQQLCVGDRVNVFMQLSVGLKAALLAYALPVIVALVMLIIMSEAGTGELAAGLWSLGSLAAYYFVLYLFRDKLKRQFTFYVEKTD